MKTSFVSPSFIKQKAKQLKKEKSLTQSQALEEAVKAYGFHNYKHYLNNSEANRKKPRPPIEVLLKNISSRKDLSEKMAMTISYIQKFGIPFSEQLDILNVLKHPGSFHYFEFNNYSDYLNHLGGVDPVQTVCEKLNLMKPEIQAYLLNDFLADAGKDDMHDVYPYFVARDISIGNLMYEINEDALCVHGDYILTCKFPFEDFIFENEEDCKDERFHDQKLCGSFRITIDRDKEITIENSHMQINTEGGFTEEDLEDYYGDFPNERGRFDDILVLDDSVYGHVKKSLLNNEPLTGKTLELALGLVDVDGDDEFSGFLRNIGVKLKAGQPLDDYECHIMVDVLLLHAQL